MGFDFRKFGDDELSETFVEWLVNEQWVDIGSHFGRLWDYYYNPRHESGGAWAVDGKASEASRNYIQAQEYGLPPRITGVVYSGSGGTGSGTSLKDIQRKEVVIENDIAGVLTQRWNFCLVKELVLSARHRRSGNAEKLRKL